MGRSQETFNRAELACAYDKSLPAIDGWVRRGCPHKRRRDGTYVFDLALVSEWRARQLSEDSQRRGALKDGRRPIPTEAREWLDGMLVGTDHMLPWLVEPGSKAALVVGVEEYRRREGIDGDELLLRLAYGLPTLPPAQGAGKGPRISLPHASAWLVMFSGFIESLGGDGLAKRIAHEAQRLRGFPTHSDESSGAGDEVLA